MGSGLEIVQRQREIDGVEIDEACGRKGNPGGRKQNDDEAEDEGPNGWQVGLHDRS
jgi:hypothetical protein